MKARASANAASTRSRTPGAGSFRVIRGVWETVHTARDIEFTFRASRVGPSPGGREQPFVRSGGHDPLPVLVGYVEEGALAVQQRLPRRDVHLPHPADDDRVV